MTIKFIKFSTVGKIAVFFWLMMNATVAAANDNVNGNACVAANLNQALELQWNHARVLNPASNPNSRFVTCTLTTGAQYTNEDDITLFTTVTNGAVTAFFGADSAANAEVSCIFREMATTATDNVAAASFAVVITADGALPDTNTEAFDTADGLELGFASYTVTCLLDPGTGINSYNTTQTLPVVAP